jgi:hypothetical protein
MLHDGIANWCYQGMYGFGVFAERFIDHRRWQFSPSRPNTRSNDIGRNLRFGRV